MEVSIKQKEPELIFSNFRKWKGFVKAFLYEIYHDIGEAGFIVGSFYKKNSWIEVRDIDVVIIFHEINVQIYQEAENRAKSLCQKLSANDKSILITPEFRQGPIKPSEYNNRIQIHFFFFEYKQLQKLEGYPFLYNWIKNNNKIFGKDLSSFVSNICIKKKALINDINNTLISINYYRIWYWEYNFNKNDKEFIMKKKWRETKSLKQYIEIVRYSRHVLKSIVSYFIKKDIFQSQALMLELNELLAIKLFYETIEPYENYLEMTMYIQKISKTLKKTLNYLT